LPTSDEASHARNRMVEVTIETSTSEKESPSRRTYACEAGRDWRVLDVLEALGAEHGVSVAYRWLCSTRRCGLCTMRMNRRPILACWEPAEDTMVLEPLESQEVLADLVGDRATYDRALESVRPYLARSGPYRGFPEPLAAAEMSSSDALAACIECLLCVEACPVSTLKAKGWAGPAVLVQLARFALDPRDGLDRRELATHAGVTTCVGPHGCHTQCEAACPTDVPILSGAILPLRELVEASSAPTRSSVPDA
jgi:fumarate reductase (CoM/CoB) subunit B